MTRLFRHIALTFLLATAACGDEKDDGGEEGTCCCRLMDGHCQVRSVSACTDGTSCVSSTTACETNSCNTSKPSEAEEEPASFREGN